MSLQFYRKWHTLILPVFYSLCVFLFLFSLTFYITQNEHKNNLEQEHQNLIRGASNVKAKFLGIIYNDIIAAQSLALIQHEIELNDRFDNIAREILNKSKYVEAIQITENGIIKKVFPLQGYENTIGINTWKDSVRKQEEVLAFKSLNIYFAGPRKLRQGGVGILGKVPSISKKGSKVLVVVLTKLPTIVEALDLKDGLESRFAYIIRKNIKGDISKFILSKREPGLNEKKVSVIIPYGNWVLDVYYNEKYKHTPYPIITLIFGILLSLMGSYITFKNTRQPYILQEIISIKTHEVNERVKELSTIYKLNKMLQDSDLTTDDLFKKLVNIIPFGWQYPEICQAKIVFNGKEYLTTNFKSSLFSQTTNFKTVDGKVGTIEVVYTEKKPMIAEGPFLKEERDLINSIAETLEIYFNKLAHELNLSESEARFRGAFEHSAIGMAIVDLNGNWLSVNKGLCDMLGYNNEEFSKLTFTQVTHPDDIKSGEDFLFSAIENKSNFFHAKKRYIHKNGSVVWVNVHAAIVRNSDGEAQYFISQIENITAKIESEIELKKKESELRTLFDSVDGPLCMIDTNKRHLIFNKSYARDHTLLAGRPPVIGGEIYDFLPIELKVKRHEILDKVLKQGVSDFVEVTYVHEGKKVYYNTSYNPVVVDSKVIGVAVYSINLTKSKEAENAIREAEMKFRSLVEKSPVGVYILKNGKFIYVNPRLVLESGYTEEELYKKTLEEFIHPDDLSGVYNNIELRLKGETDQVRYEVRAFHKAGHLIWLEIFGTTTIYEGETAIIGTMVNVTDKKQLFDEREKVVNDLLQRNRDLEQFSYIVSHNIRGPLASIIGLTDVLEIGLTDEEKKFAISGISQQSKKLDEVIKDLNTILNVKKEVTQSLVVVNLEELVKSILIDIDFLVNKNQVEIIYNFSEVNSINTNKPFIYSIFYNLMSNSIKYRSVQERPQINIWTKKENDMICIYFKDNGLGIDLKKYQDQIFGLYKRFHPNTEGKGMGLFMVKTQVNALNGIITLESEPGKGSLFKIMLPIR